MTLILGIHLGHNSTVALIENNNIISILSEERLTRRKNYSGFPFKALEKTIELYPQTVMVDRVAIPSTIYKKNERAIYTPVFKHVPKKYKQIIDKENPSIKKTIAKILEKNGLQTKINFYDHHKAHAASASYSTNLIDPLIVTSDGHGDKLSSTINILENNTIKTLHSVPDQLSLG